MHFLKPSFPHHRQQGSGTDKITWGQSEDKIQLWFCLTLICWDLLTAVIASHQTPSPSKLNGSVESHGTACLSVDKDLGLHHICDA